MYKHSFSFLFLESSAETGTITTIYELIKEMFMFVSNLISFYATGTFWHFSDLLNSYFYSLTEKSHAFLQNRDTNEIRRQFTCYLSHIFHMELTFHVFPFFPRYDLFTRLIIFHSFKKFLSPVHITLLPLYI